MTGHKKSRTPDHPSWSTNTRKVKISETGKEREKKSVRNTTEKRVLFFLFNLKKGASTWRRRLRRSKREREKTYPLWAHLFLCHVDRVLKYSASAPTRIYSTVLFLSFLLWMADGRDAIRSLATLKVLSVIFFLSYLTFCPFSFPSQVISLYIHSISSFLVEFRLTCLHLLFSVSILSSPRRDEWLFSVKKTKNATTCFNVARVTHKDLVNRSHGTAAGHWNCGVASVTQCVETKQADVSPGNRSLDKFQSTVFTEYILVMYVCT